MRKFTATTNSYRDNPSLRRNIRGHFKVSHVSISVILVALICFVGVGYLYYINQTATGGFDIKGLEKRIENVQKENKRLEIEVANLQSLSNIEAAGQAMQLVASEHIDYLEAGTSAVAVR